MSGGHFDYTQDRLTGVITEMEHILENPEKFALSDYASSKIVEAIKNIKIAQAYIQRIDWYISGDDGEEALKKRLKEDLERLQKDSLDV